ncbi:MAG: hypothetical protein ACPLSP_07360, partial [Fervidicoccus fontis]
TGVQPHLDFSSLTIYSESSDSYLEDYVAQNYSENIKILSEPPDSGSLPLESSYSEYLNMVLRELADLLIQVVKRTDSIDTEHALFLTKEGDLIVLEGERQKVVLPELKTCLFLHTHPNGVCLPSKRDIQSASSFFMNGGILFLILSSRCFFSMYRSSLINENDVYALKRLENEVEKAYLKSFNPIEYFNESLKGSNIKVRILPPPFGI